MATSRSEVCFQKKFICEGVGFAGGKAYRRHRAEPVIVSVEQTRPPEDIWTSKPSGCPIFRKDDGVCTASGRDSQQSCRFFNSEKSLGALSQDTANSELASWVKMDLISNIKVEISLEVTP